MERANALGDGSGAEDVLETQPQAIRVTRSADGRWVVHARAKLNLGLRVFPVRADGFHDIETWMVPLSWHDTLWVGDEGKLRLEVTGRSEGVPVEIEKNLVGRAAVKLAAAAGVEARGVITLHKVLPPGGGLGGGSSDAASALVALNEAWGLKWEDKKLMEIAAELGSDVPFFVKAQPSLCMGRGEIMTPMRSYHALFAVLILPPVGCPTKDVYGAFDAGRVSPMAGKTNWCGMASASAEVLRGMVVNDLEEAAYSVVPWLREVRDAAEGLIGQKVHLTGSGSTLFTLCGSGQEAGAIQEKLQGSGSALPGNCVCVPVRILRQR